MPNNVAMSMTDKEIIKLLGGVTTVANMLGIKPPSVHEWLAGGIPEYRLKELAGEIEKRSGGAFSRRERWPDSYGFYWPELATASETSEQAATPSVAQGV
jgi:DNA-binding transcriptional regulator YdaS (Cro superfamily)